MKPRVLLSVLALAGLPLSGWAADCPELLQGQSATLPAPPGESQQRPGGEQPGQLHAAPPATCRRATGRSRTGQLSSAASRLSRIDNCQTRS